VPEARAAQHGVIAVPNLDGHYLSYGTSALRVSPGVLGTRDAVGVPVHEQDPPSGQLPDRLPGRQPGSQARDRRHSWVPGDAHRGTGSHRMPDQDDRDRTEPAADVVQDPVEIMHWQSLLAIPSAELESRPEDHCAASPQRSSDGPGQRDHAQHGRLNGGSGFGTDRLATMGHHHDAKDTGRFAAVLGAS
jgi:hypothetical protein